MKTAAEKLNDLKAFLPNAKRAIEMTEKFAQLLETDPAFQRLWESDSAAALRQVGIDPEARAEMGLPPYSKGPECNWCITPHGKACHC
ncbi:MAG: hypothetical protein NTW21_44720 [Verrucomicrobia bacterium]|nr:hypothetical protein [Verrucomicrobiota bacterium]